VPAIIAGIETFYKYPNGTPIELTAKPPIYKASDKEPKPRLIPLLSKNPPKLLNPDNKDPFASIFPLEGIN